MDISPNPMGSSVPAVSPDAETAPAASQPERRIVSIIIETLQTIALAAVFYVAISLTTARVVVDGPSMRPTLQSGEWVVVNRLAYRLGQPQRGDVVVILPPTKGQTEDLIKRVVGLPGQTLEIRSGRVYVDGDLINEPYVSGNTYPDRVWNLGEDQYFLMGDNRELSMDSRSFGPISLEMVVGKADLIYWPPSEWGPLSWRVPDAKAVIDSPTPVIQTSAYPAPEEIPADQSYPAPTEFAYP